MNKLGVVSLINNFEIHRNYSSYQRKNFYYMEFKTNNEMHHKEYYWLEELKLECLAFAASYEIYLWVTISYVVTF